MPNQELKEKAKKWLGVIASLKETYGSDEIANELIYIENANPQELAGELGISEEEAKKVIEVTKSMIAIFRL